MTAQGLHKEALALWEKLGVEAAEREKLEENDNGELPQGVKMKDILAVFGKDAWRQTALGAFLMGMQQLSGIDGVLYVCLPYCSSHLKAANNGSTLLSYSNPQDSRARQHLSSPLAYQPFLFSL